ncbi:MAG: permease [Clostridia bacterium]|nr:permease [Clostridia bacterium]
MNLPNQFIILFNIIVQQFKLIFPYWIAGVFTGSLLSVFAAARITSLAVKISGNRFRLTGLIFAACLGVASPICMYGTVPIIASLGRKNVPQYFLAAFMVSSILLNPNLLILSFALGPGIAVLRLSVSIAAGVLAGILVYALYKNDSLFSFEGFEDRKKCSSQSSMTKTFFSDLYRGIDKTAPYFLAGIILTALFDRYFPKDIIIRMFDSNKGLGVLLAASLGVPIYVCGGGTIPLIRACLQAGMSIGSAAAFMITGPATKLTNLGAVKIILGKKNFAVYILYNIIFAIIVGLGTDFILGLIKK